MVKLKKGDGGFVLVIGAFIIIFGLINYFVLDMYFDLFSFTESTFFYVLLFFCIFSYLLAAALESHKDTLFNRITYIFSATWMGIMFISFIVLLLYLIIHNLLHYVGWVIGLSIFTLVMLITIYGVINAYAIRIKRITIHTDKQSVSNANVASVKSEDKGKEDKIRIVQLSDIHLGPVNMNHYLKRIVHKVNSINPDVVLITGDMVDGRFYYSNKTFNILNDITAPVYFVAGNHELYHGFDDMKSLFSETKVKWLHDEIVTFKGINIIGFDYGSTVNSTDGLLNNLHLKKTSVHGQDTIGSLLYGMKYKEDFTNKFTVLMVHKPTGWKDASKYVDLMIAGHTHSGQIWPFNYLTWLDGHAIYGVHRVKTNPKFMLYVTSGTGTWGPPIRIGSRTEIVVFEVQNNK